ncbi:hypothetical protein FSARC_14583 [Fusarium sarcochroum]|uniref:Xylanolytic transcriptional activator regulatory domain-containing protein n=1 Tax=Fusarium sarcochroum TaxID=1208366 RepID=A0A8H4SSI0_9HYPO|nr:hypothetical protein FSARC_14583 [Fusarium sarcochroum]
MKTVYGMPLIIVKDELSWLTILEKERIRLEPTDDNPDTLTLASGDESSDGVPDSTDASGFPHLDLNTAAPPWNDQSALPSPVENGGDGESYALKNKTGAMRFFGASSGFPTVCPVETHVVGGPLGHNSPRNTTRQTHNKWGLVDWYPQGLRDDTLLEKRYSQPLPTKPLLLELVQEYFATFNQVLPIFNQANFMSLVDRQFSWNPNSSPSWWAVFNMVLAFAYRNRAEKFSEDGDNWRNCIGHVKNAMSVTTELFLRTCDLLAVQGMICLALFFQGTPNPQPLFAFTATAIRFSQSIGLHRSKSFGLSKTQVEERQRVFWIAFILDADVCVRTGRPATQDIRDFDVPPPPDSPSDGLGVIECCGEQLNFLTTLTKFALIQRRVYDSLYTTEALKRPPPERVANAEQCLGELDRWRDSIPDNLKPQRNFSLQGDSFLTHILRLHFASHCCYLSIYRVCLLSRQPLRSELSTKQSEVARSALDLVKHIYDERFGQSFGWSVVYFPAAATVALLSQMIANANSPDASSDLSLVDETLRFLSRIASQEPDTYVDHVLSVCSDLRNTAKETIKLAKSGSSHAIDQDQHNPSPYNQTVRQDRFLAEAGLPVENESSYTDPFDLPGSLFWGWQDMLIGAPPACDFDAQGFDTENDGHQ